MEGRLLFKGCAVFRADGRVRRDMAVVVEGPRIAQVAPDAEVPVRPGDWAVSCRDRLLMPGLVDCHSHLVGGQLAPAPDFLLRGSSGPGRSHQGLDRGLTPGEVEALTALGLARAIRGGVTLVAEHLTAPQDVLGSLLAQARVAERLGVRLTNSHATVSRPGDAGVGLLEANASYVEGLGPSALVRPALGFQTSHTADDALLSRLGPLRERLRAPLHLHLAESEDDLTQTYARSGLRVVPRLDGFGLLGPHVIAAYARSIDMAESARLAQSGAFTALTPGSSLAEEPVGRGLELIFAHPNQVGMASGGIGALGTLLSSAVAAMTQLGRSGRPLDPDELLGQFLIAGPSELCTRLYGAPSGAIEPAALADLIVLDHVPPEEDSRLSPQLLLQLGQVQVAWSVVNGRVLMREGQLLGADFLDLAADGARALSAVWKRAA